MFTMFPMSFRSISGDTNAYKMQFSTIKQIFFEILTISRNIGYIIIKINMVIGTTVSNLVLEKNAHILSSLL